MRFEFEVCWHGAIEVRIPCCDRHSKNLNQVAGIRLLTAAIRLDTPIRNWLAHCPTGSIEDVMKTKETLGLPVSGERCRVVSNMQCVPQPASRNTCNEASSAKVF